MAKHKHTELIKAWADGAEIEYFLATIGEWCNAYSPSWVDNLEYRVKEVPLPKIYPEILVSDWMLDSVYIGAELTSGRLREVANFAIRSAIDNRQVIIPDR